jgi:hypothetical protein
MVTVVLSLGVGHVYPAEERITWWPVQSIDTMKNSRDQSRNRLNDPTYDQVIESQIRDIAAVGTTHVALATPYDDEFIPLLDKWIAAARKYNLNVWFRGNFSGWEKWFSYPQITREEHLAKLARFIPENAEIFRDGDIFSTCPECENGGPGDPRQTGDIEGYRRFLLEEYRVCRSAFEKIGKDVKCNYFSMNGDVAKLIMDRNTTAALGGIVVIDHYVQTPDQLAADIRQIARNSGGRVVLGEMGAPIPDIHGEMTEEQQAEWLTEAFSKLTDIPELIGVNYWLNIEGSTALWTNDGKPKPAVESIKQAFHVYRFTSIATDSFGRPMRDVSVMTGRKTIMTGSNGTFSIPYTLTDKRVTLSKPGYTSVSMNLPVAGKIPQIVMYDNDTTIIHTLKTYTLYFWDVLMRLLDYPHT